MPKPFFLKSRAAQPAPAIAPPAYRYLLFAIKQNPAHILANVRRFLYKMVVVLAELTDLFFAHNYVCVLGFVQI